MIYIRCLHSIFRAQEFLLLTFRSKWPETTSGLLLLLLLYSVWCSCGSYFFFGLIGRVEENVDIWSKIYTGAQGLICVCLDGLSERAPKRKVLTEILKICTLYAACIFLWAGIMTCFPGCFPTHPSRLQRKHACNVVFPYLCMLSILQVQDKVHMLLL